MTSNMTLFNYTLQRPQNAYLAVAGYFSAPPAAGTPASLAARTQEVVVARTKGLELFRLVDGTFVSVLYTDIFGIIRDMQPFRLPGTDQDLLILSSDSGKFIVLRYCGRLNRFERVVEETFGKTGARRIVPGQHLAIDPEGRAVMVCALEKSKLVFTLSAGQPTPTSTSSISSNEELLPPVLVKSPLEAHTPHTVIFSSCGVSVPGFSNPTFACLEASYEDNTDVEIDAQGRRVLTKSLVFYELDLGVNSITRIMAQPVDAAATSIHTVPCDAASGGPGGVLVCAEDAIYLHPYLGPSTAEEDEESILSKVLRAPLPRRFELDPSAHVMVTSVSLALTRKKRRGAFHFLLQTELGDVLRCDISATVGDDADGMPLATATDLSIGYFDSAPPSVACVTVESSMTRPERSDDKLIATDHLFLIAETGAMHVFRINSKPELTAVSSHSSASSSLMTEKEEGEENEEDYEYYQPTAGKNLLEVQSDLLSAQPILALLPPPVLSSSLSTIPSELITLAGTGHRATVRALRAGLGVEELLRSPLPGNPSALFAVRESVDPTSPTSLLVLSFPDYTIALRAGESMEEVEDSGLLAGVESLLVAPILEGMAAGDASAGDSSGAMIQVHSAGARLIRQTPRGIVVADWRAPGVVIAAASNDRQLALALSSGEIFVVEPEGGQLRDICRTPLAGISSIALAPIPFGHRRAPFLVAGDFQNIVRVLRIIPGRDQSNTLSLSVVARKVMASSPHSLSLISHAGVGRLGIAPSTSTRLTLYVGMNNGLLERLAVDSFSGHLSDPHARLLGSLPVRLQSVTLGGHPAVFGMSSRPWAFYEHAGSLNESPLAYDPFIAAAPFSSTLDPYGVMVVSSGILRLISLPKLGGMFHQRVSAPLYHTPRRAAWYVPSSVTTAVLHEAAKGLISSTTTDHNAPISVIPAAAVIVLEADDGALPFSQRQEIQSSMRAELAAAESKEGNDMSDGLEDKELTNAAQDYHCGVPRAESGVWGSCIRLVNPITLETSAMIELSNNLAATSLCVFDTDDGTGDSFLVVGVVKSLVQIPRRVFESAAIHTYRISQTVSLDQRKEREEEEGEGEEASDVPRLTTTINVRLLHTTPVTDFVGALAAVRREGLPTMLLAGCGPTLKLFELGKRRLLLKLENRHIPSAVTHLEVSPCGARAYVGDSAEGVVFIALDPMEGRRRLDLLAISPTPRFVSSMCVMDFDTVAIADRFGNIAIQRLSKDASETAEENLTAAQSGSFTDIGVGNGLGIGLNERPRKPPVHLTELAGFHVGDMVTCMTKTTLVPGGPSVLMYGTISGAISALVPLASYADAEYFTHLEMYMRRDVGSLVGRDHLSFRSAYHPVNSVIDGDLLNIFAAAHAGAGSVELSREQLQEIAESVASTPKDVVKKLNEIKQRIM